MCVIGLLWPLFGLYLGLTEGLRVEEEGVVALVARGGRRGQLGQQDLLAPPEGPSHPLGLLSWRPKIAKMAIYARGLYGAPNWKRVTRVKFAAIFDPCLQQFQEMDIINAMPNSFSKLASEKST